MNDDNGFGVPAGWYPDPLGLPQMRWWDNHGWTEHTTEARAPVVIQEAKLAWADDEPEVDELPTRREMREREQRQSGATDDGTDSPDSPTADALLELEAPSWDALPADQPAPDVLLVPQFTSAQAAAHQRPAAESATPVTTQAENAPFAHGTAPSTNTAGGWIIALLPLAQLLGTLLVVAAAGASGTSVGVILTILIAPYFISIPFAIGDQRALRRHGYERPASWAWVFLGPVYLIARAVRILMRAGNGFTPILVWGALVLLQLGSIVAVPGLVISALPHVFAEQAAQSVQQAAVFGPRTSVSCPAPPATVMGQQFTCTMQRIPSGQKFNVTVSLERQNGWIAWVVTDWGTYGMYR
ncbi:MAG: hypothetical protein QOK08_43 [Actinomycetota bacterium]|nr:hypothetical protein [Actinomycetota bacterium]